MSAACVCVLVCKIGRKNLFKFYFSTEHKCSMYLKAAVQIVKKMIYLGSISNMTLFLRLNFQIDIFYCNIKSHLRNIGTILKCK